MAKKKKPVELKLTDAEIARYEEADLKRKISKLQIAAQDLEVSLCKEREEKERLKQRIFALQKLGMMRDQADSDKEHKEFNDGVCERLELKTKSFGFSPLTGEVIPN